MARHWQAILDALVPLLLLLTGAGALGGALIGQYWGGLQPCILCFYQRWPHGIAAGLGLLAFWAPGRWRAAVSGLGGCVLLIGAAIAFFHVGVEEHWWPGTASCGATLEGARTIDDLRQALLATPAVRCDVPLWSLFGVSMAGYNMLLSLLVGGVVLAGAAISMRQA